MGGGVVLISHLFCPRLYVRVQRDKTMVSVIKSGLFNTFSVIEGSGLWRSDARHGIREESKIKQYKLRIFGNTAK